MFGRIALPALVSLVASLFVAMPQRTAAERGECVDGTTSSAVPVRESLLATAETLSRSFRATDRWRSICLFQELLALAREEGDPGLESEVSLSLGDLHRGFGLNREAAAFYERALGSGDGALSVAVRAHIGLSRAFLWLDDLKLGRRHAERSWELSQRLENEGLKSAALVALGVAYYDSRELEPARRLFEMVLERMRGGGLESDEKTRAEAALHLGYALTDLADEPAAIDAFQRALAISRAADQELLIPAILVALGHAHSKLGEKQRALELYHQAAPLLEELENPFVSGSFYTGMGYLYDELGDYRNARDFYLRALAIHEALGSPSGRAANLVHLGRIHRSLGEPQQALKTFREASRHLPSFGERRLQSVVSSEMAGVLAALGKNEDAREEYARALALSREGGYVREEAEILNGLGELDLRQGLRHVAESRFRRALTLSRKTDAAFTESGALFQLARLDRATGDLDGALAMAEEALALVGRLRTKIASHRLRTTYIASVFELHSFHVDLLMELDERRPGEGYDERAFLAAERARARSLLEMLQPSYGTDSPVVDPSLVDREARLADLIRKKASAWDDSRSPWASGAERQGPGSGHDPPSVDDLLAELDRVRALRKAPRATESPGRLLGLSGVPELQRELLDPETALLAYFLGDRTSYLWVVTSSDIRVHLLPARGLIESRARALYDLLAMKARRSEETAKELHDRMRRQEERYWKLALPFSDMLLKEAISDLDVRRLLVIGDGILHQIPFSTLPVPGGPALPGKAAPQSLVERFEIVRLPSASILEALVEQRKSWRPPARKLAVLADPVFDPRDPRLAGEEDVPSAVVAAHSARPDAVPSSRHRGVGPSGVSRGSAMTRLLSTRREARRLLELVPPTESFGALGFEANRTLVTSGALSAYEVVHFATHGILNSDRPELSGIVLSLFDEEGERRDGFLPLNDIYELELPVRLVVLSACSTGLGKNVRGEGLVGLVAGFLATGAQGVVASYWDVDDEATAELMSRFYAHLFGERLAPSEALKLAQISMSREKRWASPYFWGAFELQGQWR